ncbi:MAG: 50S ribosomal protein L10 [Clostridia bacterium]|nr:50S ribosomal protein L10 [Clostridia bacterium]
MSANFENKKQIVEDIKDKISKAKCVVFVDYRGINVANDTELRNKMREAGCEYHVYKNRLVKLALKDLEISCLDDKLEGTLAVAFSYNGETDAASIIDKMSDKAGISMKFGLLDNNYIDDAALKALANLPSKEVLIAQLLGMLQAPARNLCYALNGTVQGLVRCLNGIATKN